MSVRILTALAIITAVFFGCRPHHELSQDKAIHGEDDRVETDIAGSIWTPIGYLEIDTDPGKAACTATLVGPSTILTASHCAKGATKFHVNLDYHTGDSAAVAEIDRIIAVGEEFDVRYWSGEKYWYRNRQHDWALLKLKESWWWLAKPVGKKFGTLKMRKIKSTDNLQDLRLVGYPGDWQGNGHPVRMYNSKTCGIVGKVEDNGMFKTNCDNYRCQSGAPFLARDGNGNFTEIIGIFISGFNGTYKDDDLEHMDTGITVEAAMQHFSE